MFERPIDFKNGLVDPESLMMYMNGCYCSNVIAPHPGGHKSEYHHLYFPMSGYKGDQYDLRLRVLRNSKYNQLEMLSCQEDYFHQQSYEEVPAEEIDLNSADEFLREQSVLTSYAASSLLVAETANLLRVKELLPRAEAARIGARLAIFSEMQHEQTEGVKKIEFMSRSVVTGALRQYLAQRPEKEMAKLLEQSGGTTELNTRIYGVNGLANVAEFNLQKKIEEKSWTVRRLLAKPAIELVEPLQTEVDEVELAA